ncbi:PTS system, fructose-specific IIB component [Spiroplasma corruscae]|uniref:PTS system, fructose-specific IIB component n=1 Tax=Spiroplasma corruscae TaxID=216934 RepID=A0A222EPW9_9MOLU|nr:fructose-specific PTS transporter subunit EIIC [Spiroplasma corruscae]ASP28567.1 PTS system, fructose-specific IIB component [Spiroplasma corruscae]
MIINKENVLIYVNKDFKSIENLFIFISQKLYTSVGLKERNDYINFKSVYDDSIIAYSKDNFILKKCAIPEIKDTFIICVKNNRLIKTDKFEKTKNFFIFVLHPIKENFISNIIFDELLKKLKNKEFRDIIKTIGLTFEIENLLISKKPLSILNCNTVTKCKPLNIVAITSCKLGLAHSYIAEEKLINKLTLEGHQIRVEVQGYKTIKNELTTKEIYEADIVLIGAETNIDKTRFIGKKVYQTNVIEVIKDPLNVLNQGVLKSKVYFEDINFITTLNKEDKSYGLVNHISYGMNYLIPIIIIGGLCSALSLFIAKIIWGPNSDVGGPNNIEYPNNPLVIMKHIGSTSFMLMVPVLAAFIAKSIGGNYAIAPALVGGYIGNDVNTFFVLPGIPTILTPLGFIGAILSGFLVGNFTKWVNSWRVGNKLKNILGLFFIPIFGVFGITIIFVYLIGSPIGWIMHKFMSFIYSLYNVQSINIVTSIILGMILGGMICFDIGGPINKITFLTGVSLLNEQISEPMAIIGASLPIAPISIGITTLVLRRYFDDEQRSAGVSAIIMGIIGISEGAIPLTIKDPKRAVFANVCGGIITGGIVGLSKIHNNVSHGGPIVAVLGFVLYGRETILFFLSILIGVSINVIIYSLLLINSKGTIGSLKETYYTFTINTRIAYTKKIDDLKSSAKFLQKDIDKDKLDDIYNKIRILRVEYKAKTKVGKKYYKELYIDDKKDTINNKIYYKTYISSLKNWRKQQLISVKNNVKNMKLKDKILISKEKKVISNEFKKELYHSKISLHERYVNLFKEKIKV